MHKAHFYYLKCIINIAFSAILCILIIHNFKKIHNASCPFLTVCAFG